MLTIQASRYRLPWYRRMYYRVYYRFCIWLAGYRQPDSVDVFIPSPQFPPRQKVSRKTLTKYRNMDVVNTDRTSRPFGMGD